MITILSLTSSVLVGLRLIGFLLALGLTLISFQAFRENQTKTLELAFIGFAFISMAMALGSLWTPVNSMSQLLAIAETLAFIVGFAMLYLSLYR